MESVRKHACNALVQIGEAAISALQEPLRDSNVDVAPGAAIVIGRIVTDLSQADRMRSSWRGTVERLAT